MIRNSKVSRSNPKTNGSWKRQNDGEEGDKKINDL